MTVAILCREDSIELELRMGRGRWGAVVLGRKGRVVLCSISD